MHSDVVRVLSEFSQLFINTWRMIREIHTTHPFEIRTTMALRQRQKVNSSSILSDSVSDIMDSRQRGR